MASVKVIGRKRAHHQINENGSNIEHGEPSSKRQKLNFDIFNSSNTNKAIDEYAKKSLDMKEIYERKFIDFNEMMGYVLFGLSQTNNGIFQIFRNKKLAKQYVFDKIGCGWINVPQSCMWTDDDLFNIIDDVFIKLVLSYSERTSSWNRHCLSIKNDIFTSIKNKQSNVLNTRFILSQYFCINISNEISSFISLSGSDLIEIYAKKLDIYCDKNKVSGLNVWSQLLQNQQYMHYVTNKRTKSVDYAYYHFRTVKKIPTFELLKSVMTEVTFIDITDDIQLECLGKGGFGKVSLVQRDTNLLAVKQVTDYNNIREINNMKQITRYSHPNITSMISLAYSSNSYYIEMHAGIMSLRELRNKMKRMADHNICIILCQLINGVYYLHHVIGLLHGDLKPDNVIVTRSRCVQICDFGSAIEIEKLPLKVKGTICYHAPEQLASYKCGPKVDVFALGAILGELLNGRTIFFSKKHDDKNIEKFDVLRMYMTFMCPEMAFHQKSFGKKLSINNIADGYQYETDYYRLLKSMLNNNIEQRASIQQLKNDAFIEQFNNKKLELCFNHIPTLFKRAMDKELPSTIIPTTTGDSNGSDNHNHNNQILTDDI